MNLAVLCLQGSLLLAVAVYGFFGPLDMMRWYFLAQAVYTAATFGSRIAGFDMHSSIFTTIYILATAMMLGMGVLITFVYALEHTATTWLFFGGVLVSLLFLWANVHGQSPQTAAGWIHVVEGASLMGMGAVLGLTSPFLNPWEFKPTFTLAMMWVFLGVFRQGYRLHWDWTTANDWIPWFTTAACLLFVAWTIRASPKLQEVPAPLKALSRSSGR